MQSNPFFCRIWESSSKIEWPSPAPLDRISGYDTVRTLPWQVSLFSSPVFSMIPCLLYSLCDNILLQSFLLCYNRNVFELLSFVTAIYMFFFDRVRSWCAAGIMCFAACVRHDVFLLRSFCAPCTSAFRVLIRALLLLCVAFIYSSSTRRVTGCVPVSAAYSLARIRS